MGQLDKDYVDSIVASAAQDLRHYLEPVMDESVINIMRESLNRMEKELREV